jgi:transcriptional regulator with XRE-family HTH domain
MNTPGFRLKTLQLELRMKQADLAMMLDLTPTYLSQLANDKREISKHMALAIAQVTGCNPLWLLHGEGEMFLQRPHNATELAPEEAEIIETYRNMNPDAKRLLVASARGLAIPKKG